MIITRKIQLNINGKDKAESSDFYKTLYRWSFICQKAANLVTSHLFFLNNTKDFFYLVENVKLKLSKEESLKTSLRNIGYQLLSKNWKGEIPTDILTNLNNLVYKSFQQEKKEYYAGKRSLRSYKTTIPIPFSKTHIRNLTVTDIERDGKTYQNYNFDLFSIPFTIFFGRDRSNNRAIIDRIMTGEYEMKNSSIQLKNNKIFLLLAININEKKLVLDDKKTVTANFSLSTPIIAKCGRYKKEIGNKDEFLHRRLQIQMAMQRIQKAGRYNVGGKGRKKKLKSIDFFKEKEHNYIQTKIHQYSKQLIDFALKVGAKNIKLMDMPEDAKDLDDYLIRNWSYYSLNEKLKYKAMMNNIIIE